MGGLALIFIASLLVALAVVLTHDPEEAWAVSVAIVATGVAAGAAVTLLQLRKTNARSGRRAPRLRRDLALRRGAEVAVLVALLLWLRAVDGLSVVTAAFGVLAFVIAEMILSARPHSSR